MVEICQDATWGTTEGKFSKKNLEQILNFFRGGQSDVESSPYYSDQYSEERMLDDFDTLQETINRSKSTHEDRENFGLSRPSPNNHNKNFQRKDHVYNDPYDDYYEEEKYPDDDSYIRIKDSKHNSRKNRPPRARKPSQAGQNFRRNDRN